MAEKIIIFGASNLGKKVYERLKSNKKYMITYFTDNDKEKWNNYIFDVKIISPFEALKFKEYTFVFASIYYKEIIYELNLVGYKKYIFFEEELYNFDEVLKKANLVKKIDNNLYDFSNINYFKPNDNSIIYINPNEVIHSGMYFYPRLFENSIIDGNWDVEKSLFENKEECFDAFKQHFIKKIPWEKINYYLSFLKTAENLIKDTGTAWGINNIEDVKHKFIEWELIYNDIRNSGWKQDSNSDYITVNIDRSGKRLFNDGRHRLTMAKLLSLKSIPVKVIVTHSINEKI